MRKLLVYTEWELFGFEFSALESVRSRRNISVLRHALRKSFSRHFLRAQHTAYMEICLSQAVTSCRDSRCLGIQEYTSKRKSRKAIATIKFHPHRNMIMPACWMNANKSCCDSRCNSVINSRMSVSVSLELL